jgi:apolipoprotein N-acyltransferase
MIRMMAWLRSLAGWRRQGVALLAGAGAALALPPYDLWPALPVAIPVLLLLLEGIAARSWRASFLAGWSFGLGYFLVAFHWIGQAFLVDAATYLWMMPFAVGGLAAAMAIYWGLAALAARLLGGQGLPLAVAFAGTLAIAEDLRGRLFTGFPWAVPGLAVDGLGPLGQAASLVGMTGLTLLLVLWAGLPLAMGRGRGQGLAAVALLALLPVLHGFGVWRLSGADGAEVAGVRLRIVQPDISQDDKWRADNARAIFDELKSQSAQPRQDGALPTHIIWPESAVPFLIDESPVAREELATLLGGRAMLITGALRRDLSRLDADGEPAVHNSVIAFDGRGEVIGRYDKWRLVPGGEFLPFAWLLEPLGFRKVVTVPGNLQAGPGPVTLTVPGAPGVALLVCYEAIFPHDLVAAAKRPGWIVNVTNDGWFGTSTGPYQHLAQARLRAIEQGLPIVRAANTGISAVIDGYGRYRQVLGLGQAGIVDSGLPVALSPPPYGSYGDLCLAGLAGLCLLGAGLARLRAGQGDTNQGSVKV